MATVSVLIPTYNREKQIQDALESVFLQTYTDYEVVVVDDGSTDNTEEALKPWLDKIRYVKKENGGPASARNVGLQHIQTEFVAFLDSDDRWEPTFLQVVMTEAQTNKAIGFVTTAHILEPEGEKRPRIPETKLEGDLFPRLFQRNFVTTSAVLARRACFEKVGFFREELRQVEDYDMWLRIAREYPIVFLKDYLCRYRSVSESLSKNVLEQKLCLQAVLQSNYDPDRISTIEWRRRYSRAQVSLGRAYVKVAQNAPAKECFRDAIQLTPWRFRPWRYFLFPSV